MVGTTATVHERVVVGLLLLYRHLIHRHHHVVVVVVVVGVQVHSGFLGLFWSLGFGGGGFGSLLLRLLFEQLFRIVAQLLHRVL